MIEERRNLYSILSFMGESIDSMRTFVSEKPIVSDLIYSQLKKIINEFEQLDKFMDENKFR